jgi:plasmid stabilization system protein ParE
VAEVIWSGEAHTWLLRIHDYISQDDAEAADQLINDVYAYAQQLAKFPKLGYR